MATGYSKNRVFWGADLVVRGAADREGALLVDDFGKAIVGNLDVAIAVNQQILGLEIAVHDAFGVDVLQRQQHVGRVELRGAICEGSLHIQVVEQLATYGIFQALNHG